MNLLDRMLKHRPVGENGKVAHGASADQPSSRPRGGVRLSEEVRDELLTLLSAGELPGHVAQLLGISITTVLAYGRAAGIVAAMPPRPADPTNAMTQAVEKMAGVMGDTMAEKLREAMEPPAPVYAERAQRKRGRRAQAWPDERDDDEDDDDDGYSVTNVIERAKAQAAIRAVERPEVQAAIVDQVVTEITGNVRAKDKSLTEQIAEVKQLAGALGLSNGSDGDGEGGPWIGVAKFTIEKLADNPYTANGLGALMNAVAIRMTAGQQQASQPAQNGHDPAQIAAAQPAGTPYASLPQGQALVQEAPATAAQPVAAADPPVDPVQPDGDAEAVTQPTEPLLLNLISALELDRVTDEPDPQEAADLAWDCIIDRSEAMGEDEKAEAGGMLRDFLAMPESQVTMALGIYATDPAWRATIARINGRGIEWREAFRSALKAIFDGDGERDGEDALEDPEPDEEPVISASGAMPDAGQSGRMPEPERSSAPRKLNPYLRFMSDFMRSHTEIPGGKLRQAAAVEAWKTHKIEAVS